MHGDETRAKTLDAGEVLVAVRLVDLALAAELGLQRLHRDAVRRLRAIAATFADELVDESALGGIRIEPALAAAALFRGAGLVVDHDRKTLDVAQLALHGVELAAMMDGRALREVVGVRVFGRIVRDDREPLDALGPDLMRDLGDVEAALGRLAAGHRDGVV